MQDKEHKERTAQIGMQEQAIIYSAAAAATLNWAASAAPITLVQRIHPPTLPGLRSAPSERFALVAGGRLGPHGHTCQDLRGSEPLGAYALGL